MALIDRVKFNGTEGGDWLVCKFPSEQLSTDTRLIVGEGQAAVFVKGGSICDIFYPGTYTLKTENIPLLRHLINIPYGGKTPFAAEIYFFNTTSKLDFFWGTKDPIQLIDPKFNVRLRVRAYGQFGLKIKDYRKFLGELIGSLGPYQVCNKAQIMEYFKGYMITKLKTIISNEIIEKKISALEISMHLDALSETARLKLEAEFENYGIELVNFFIESINFPDEDFDAINKILTEKAAFDIIGDQRYSKSRTFDVYEKIAENNSGSMGTTIASMGLGFGMTENIDRMSNSSINKISSMNETQGQERKSCVNCGSQNDGSALFCNQCGNKFKENNYCNMCGNLNTPDSLFCSKCGNKLA